MEWPFTRSLRCPVLSPPGDTGRARGFPGPVAGSSGCPGASVDPGGVAGGRPAPFMPAFSRAIGRPWPATVVRRQPPGLLGRDLRSDPDQALAQILATV